MPTALITGITGQDGSYLDALMTLSRRARRGEPVMQAHRSHLYQRIANGNAGHGKVTLAYAAAAAVGAILGLWLQSASPFVKLWAITAYTLASISVWWLLDARYPLAERPMNAPVM